MTGPLPVAMSPSITITPPKSAALPVAATPSVAPAAAPTRHPNTLPSDRATTHDRCQRLAQQDRPPMEVAVAVAAGGCISSLAASVEPACRCGRRHRRVVRPHSGRTIAYDERTWWRAHRTASPPKDRTATLAWAGRSQSPRQRTPAAVPMPRQQWHSPGPSEFQNRAAGPEAGR